jgi:signal transduction histidine kinase/DNA-binding response OmpR family regulator/streptogramin lyase
MDNDQDLLAEKNIFSIYEDSEGSTWIGGEWHGIYKLNQDFSAFNFYLEFDGWIYDIHQDSNDMLWICHGKGFTKFNPQKNSAKRYLDIETYGIIEDKDGILWIAAGNGKLISFDPVTETSISYTLSDIPGIDKDSRLLHVSSDGKGTIWITSEANGLLKLNLPDNNLEKVKQLSQYFITSLFIDKSDILWCGTNGFGLIRYDPNTDTRMIISENDGLLSNTVVGIEEDNSGNLWISSKRGLSKYNPESKGFNHFFKENGFSTNNFSYLAHNKNSKGKLFFGSSSGFITFHPDNIKENRNIPNIVLTDLKVNRRSIETLNDSFLHNSIPAMEKIELNFDQNNISISYAALDFTFPKKNNYSFKLEDYENQWRAPGKERTAYYTNLDPGEYIFRVKGSNSDGVWNNEGASLRIIINPPWWKTNPAYISYVVLIIMVIYFARRYELNRIFLRNESDRLKELDQLKSRFFANISHEFRTPLTLILGPLQKLIQNQTENDRNKDYNLIHRNALRLQRLINQLLDISRLEAGKLKLNAREYDIVALTRAIVANFESHAKKRNICLTFNSTLKTQNAYLNFDKFEKILTNLLSNAFKFSDDDTTISVSLDKLSDSKTSFKEGFARLCIQDQGIGVKKEHIDKIFQRFYQVDDTATRGYEGSGIGLTLVKEMVDLHYGTIAVKSEPGKGTTFIVCLPLGKSHLNIEEIEQLPVDEIKVPDEPLDETVLRILNENTDQLPLVLIVEDNIDVQQYIGSFLEEDHNLIFADNGKEGLDRAIQEIPDLIISDVMMPVMDGIELSTELKSDERTSHIPVILLTARATVEDKVEGLETGADDYLQKPFDVHELKVRIKNLIEQRKLLKEKFAQEDGFLISKISKTPADERFVNRMMDIISDNISEPTFKIESLSKEIGMSRMQLHRKIQGLFGQSPGQFLRSLRLKQSAELLKNVTGNISEIAYDVGFESPAHFTSSFRRHFGITPSEYQKQQSTT